MGASVIGNLDLEADRIAFGRSAVATGKCLDGNQVRISDNIHRFGQIIACSARVVLIAHGSGGRIGDRIATLAHVNGSFKDQRCRSTNRNVTDAKDSVYCTIRALRYRAVVGSRRQACWKQIVQEHASRIIATIVCDFDLEGNNVAFIRSCIATEQRFDRHQIGFNIHAAEVNIGSIVVDVLQVICSESDDSIGVGEAKGSDVIGDTVTVVVCSGCWQTTFSGVRQPIVVAVCVQEVKGAIAIGIFRRSKRTTMYDRRVVERINNSVTIGIGPDRWSLETCGGLVFNSIGNAICVTVQIKEVSDAVHVGVHWCRAEHIPNTITIGIGEARYAGCDRCRGFGSVNRAIHVGVSCDRGCIAAFNQIADAVVVAVKIAPVVNSITISVAFDCSHIDTNRSTLVAVLIGSCRGFISDRNASHSTVGRDHPI